VSPEQKKQRIEELKGILIRLLQDECKKIKQLHKEDCVTIIALMDDKNIKDPSGSKTIVLRVCKKDLDEVGNKKDELRKRIKIVEY